jgi:putative effector of murein hydrolase
MQKFIQKTSVRNCCNLILFIIIIIIIISFCNLYYEEYIVGENMLLVYLSDWYLYGYALM